MNFEAAAIAYVKYVLEALNIAPGALARGAGIAPSTLTRALNDPKHKFKLSTTTIEKISNFSNINPAPFFEAKDAADLSVSFHDQEHKRLGEGESRGLRNTLIIGDVELNKWREPSVVNVFDYGPFALTSTHHDPKDCFGCVVRGDSANMMANEGDILFCVRLTEARILGPTKYPRLEAVVVQRRSKDEFKIELTARLLKSKGDGWDLISAHTADHTKGKKKRLVETVHLKKLHGDQDFVVIGTIEWVIRGDTPDALNFIMREDRA